MAFKPKLYDCCICYESFKAEEGVFCGDVDDPHFTCKACFAMHVKTECEKDIATLTANEGKITCVEPDCTCTDAFSGADIALAAPAHFDLYMQAFAKIADAKARADTLEQVEREQAAERKRQAQMTADEREADNARKHIVEDILNLKCPRKECRQVFVDFDGCAALSCSRCGAGVCAYCLKDCGRDAHAHVAACPHKPVAMTGAGGYGGMDSFNHHQRARKERLIHAYVKTLPKDVAKILLSKIAGDLDGTGIKVPTV